MSDYTWAQVSTCDSLAQLIDAAYLTLTNVQSADARSEVRDLIRTAKALLIRVTEYETWIEPAQAFILVGCDLLKRVLGEAWTRIMAEPR